MQVLVLVTGRLVPELGDDETTGGQRRLLITSAWPGKRISLAVGLHDGFFDYYKQLPNYQREEVSSVESVNVFNLHMFAEILSVTRQNLDDSAPWQAIRSLGFQKQFL